MPLCSEVWLARLYCFLPNALPPPPFSFNRIDLPPYESYDKLYEKLTCAIEQTIGFHVE